MVVHDGQVAVEVRHGKAVGIGNPRCCKNCTTCPGTCTVGK